MLGGVEIMRRAKRCHSPANLGLLALVCTILLFPLACGLPDDESGPSAPPPDPPVTPTSPDRNGDGSVNILLLGSSVSLAGGAAFSVDLIATELTAFLAAAGAADGSVNVVVEDLHRSKPLVIGLGQNGAEYTYAHHSHSLAQYYYWPEEQAARWANLRGEGAFVWDHVVIAPDPYLVATFPGFTALGASKVAAKVTEGGAQPLLLSVWPQAEGSATILDHMERVAQRVGAGASVELPVVPAAQAWRGLGADWQDTGRLHPTPNGAALTAAAIYSHLAKQKAPGLEGALAEAAWAAVGAGAGPGSGDGVFRSPFAGCDVTEDVISYHHTGSSSERGILGGLNWVFEQAAETLQNGGESPINFNYGRANSNFEPNKRYQVDPERFQFSFGFPMRTTAITAMCPCCMASTVGTAGPSTTPIWGWLSSWWLRGSCPRPGRCRFARSLRSCGRRSRSNRPIGMLGICTGTWTKPAAPSCTPCLRANAPSAPSLRIEPPPTGARGLPTASATAPPGL
ncbi:MAG: hypothetical protein CMH55_09945 [Myxococcales bacterium]|nr:hypothetical protein [Myxococcales bacterium]